MQNKHKATIFCHTCHSNCQGKKSRGWERDDQQYSRIPEMKIMNKKSKNNNQVIGKFHLQYSKITLEV